MRCWQVPWAHPSLVLQCAGEDADAAEALEVPRVVVALIAALRAVTAAEAGGLLPAGEAVPGFIAYRAGRAESEQVAEDRLQTSF